MYDRVVGSASQSKQEEAATQDGAKKRAKRAAPTLANQDADAPIDVAQPRAIPDAGAIAEEPVDVAAPLENPCAGATVETPAYAAPPCAVTDAGVIAEALVDAEAQQQPAPLPLPVPVVERSDATTNDNGGPVQPED